MDAAGPKSLLSFLAQIPDHRSRRGRQHPLSALLGLACCAILCDRKGYSAIAEWARDHDISLMHRLGFTRRPPTMYGIRKVLLALDIAAFEVALSRWAAAVLGRVPADADADGPPQALAPDGKTARGSFDGLQEAVHLLSLVAHESGLTLAQAAVPDGAHDKTNEHKAALTLLEGLVLHGRLVTGDAIFCQRDFCQEVVDSGGDYLVIVKDNQPTLRAGIEAAFAPAETAASSPSAASALGWGDRRGRLGRQGARPARAPDALGDDGVERPPGLAGCGAGRAGRERGDAGRQGLARGAPLHHQRAAVAGPGGDAAGLGAGPLVDREPVALGAGRDDGRGRQPDPQGGRSGGDGGAAERGDRGAARAGSDEHRGGAATQRDPRGGALRQLGHPLTVKGPGLVYALLTRGESYVAQAMEEYERQYESRRLGGLSRQAAAPGYRLEPLPTG